MAHVTIDHCSASWFVSGPVIQVSIFSVSELEVIIILTWFKAKCSTAAACDCFSKKNIFACKGISEPTPLSLCFKICFFKKTSDLLLFIFCVCLWSFPEQPVDHSIPVSGFLADQQLCFQLPAPLASQSDHKLGKRCLPSLVRPGHICADTAFLFLTRGNVG